MPNVHDFKKKRCEHFSAGKRLSNLINFVHSSKSPTKLHCEQERGKVNDTGDENTRAHKAGAATSAIRFQCIRVHL